MSYYEYCIILASLLTTYIATVHGFNSYVYVAIVQLHYFISTDQLATWLASYIGIAYCAAVILHFQNVDFHAYTAFQDFS